MKSSIISLCQARTLKKLVASHANVIVVAKMNVVNHANHNVSKIKNATNHANLIVQNPINVANHTNIIAAMKTKGVILANIHVSVQKNIVNRS